MTVDTELFSTQGAGSAALPEDDPLVTQLRLRMIRRIRDLTAAGVKAGDLIPGVKPPRVYTRGFLR